MIIPKIAFPCSAFTFLCLPDFVVGIPVVLATFLFRFLLAFLSGFILAPLSLVLPIKLRLKNCSRSVATGAATIYEETYYWVDCETIGATL